MAKGTWRMQQVPRSSEYVVGPPQYWPRNSARWRLTVRSSGTGRSSGSASTPVEALDQLVEELLAPDRVKQVDDRHRLAVGPALAAHGDEPAATGGVTPGGPRHAGHAPPPSSPAGTPSRRNPCPKNPPTGRAWACQWSGMLRMWSST